MKARWLVALLPAGVGLGIAALTASGRLTNPILYLRVDLGTLSLLGGLLLAGVATAYLLLGMRAEKNRQQIQAQTTEERRRFLQRLDHELKNPLTAIRAGLANVVNDSTTATQREALASVEAQVLRLSRLTSDLRKLAELETRSLERASIDIAELLQEAVTLVQEQPKAEARRLTLTLPQAPWPMPAVLADWDLLFLAVYNLLDNALKFTQPGDTVEVRAFEDGAFVVIEVADTGPGIPGQELPHV